MSPVQPIPPSRRRQRSLRVQALDARHGPRSSCPCSTPPLWGWDWILPRYLSPHRLPRYEKTPHLEATNVEGMGTCEFYKLWTPCWRRRTKEAEEGREVLESGKAAWTRFRDMRPELVPETRLATALGRFYGCCICWTFGLCRMRSTAFWLWRRQEAKRHRSSGAPRHMRQPAAAMGGGERGRNAFFFIRDSKSVRVMCLLYGRPVICLSMRQSKSWILIPNHCLASW